MAAHATGDDSFALFNAQDVHAGTVSNNLEENLTAILTWRASGFAVYGGSGNTFRNLYAADQLTYPGRDDLVDQLRDPVRRVQRDDDVRQHLDRPVGRSLLGPAGVPGVCGCNSGDGAFTGIRVSNVDIVDPTYDGVMFQTKYVGVVRDQPGRRHRR